MTWATWRRSKNTIPSPPTATGASPSSRKSLRTPASTLTGIALYFYPKAVIPLIRQYIAEGNNPDQPGRLVQWLYPRTPVYTWRVPGLWFDIGSKETLEEANQIFAKF
jgi:glucose-1-phosphate thymidylyltransferase